MNEARPIEPILEMLAIQGIALPGFMKDHQRLLGLRIPSGDEVLQKFKRFLSEHCDSLATAKQTLADRRAHRDAEAGRPNGDRVTQVMTGVAFSYQGLRRLSPGAEAIPSDAFRQGLAARSSFLGDPTEPKAEGSPPNWIVGGPGKELDALFVLAGDTRNEVDDASAKLLEAIRSAGCDVSYDENGGVRPDLPGHEHFGFDDGVSQPGIRGRASQDLEDFVTPRYIDPARTPEAWLFGRPGQNLIWPGEFILGYPRSSPDPLVPGPIAVATPDWTRNGAFLVFRRLRQDVSLFWTTLKDIAKNFAALPGFQGKDENWLAARLVGRWPSGAPVNRVPTADVEQLGADKNANNDFRFDSDTMPLPVLGYQDPYPMAIADPAGITCPWSAHIRKVNTRDSGSDMGGRDSAYTRRILRVGVPFGAPAKDRYATSGEDAQVRRGLLFLSVQASIENQFEFLCARWMNDPARPKMPGGHDIFVGQNPSPGDERVRRCSLFGEGLAQTEIKTDSQWIIPTGGGYFFIPSIPAVRDILAG